MLEPKHLHHVAQAFCWLPGETEDLVKTCEELAPPESFEGVGTGAAVVQSL